MVDKRIVEELALANGFKLKEQPDGSLALNPYVFEFAEAIRHYSLAEAAAYVDGWQRSVHMAGSIAHGVRRLADD